MNLPSETYYRATAVAYTPHPPLIGSRATKVAVIGGGYAGLATALGLAERGVTDVALLEAERIGHGASGRNGGFVFGGYSLGEGALLAQLGPERARRMYQRTVDAIALIRDRIARHAIACDANHDGVLWANWFRDPEVLRSRQALLRTHFGVEWEWVERERLAGLVASPRYSAALWERNALHLHPLNFAIGLASAAAAHGVAVHEGTRVSGIARRGSEWRVTSEKGELAVEHVVLACGGYLAGLRREIDRSVLPIATYVMATEPLGERLAAAFPGTRAAVYDSRFAFDYYRPLPDTRLLWGGRISVLDRSPAAVARLLKRDLVRVFPQLADVRVERAWSGLMSYARHEMPQVLRLEEGLWCAQGFGGHGLSSTTAAGEVLASAIAERDRAWEDYAPYGLVSAFKPFGFAGAQATYSWLQWRDALKERAER